MKDTSGYVYAGESRGELLSWLNGLLRLGISKIEQCGTGAVYCQIMDSLFLGGLISRGAVDSDGVWGLERAGLGAGRGRDGSMDLSPLKSLRAEIPCLSIYLKRILRKFGRDWGISRDSGLQTSPELEQ